MREATRVEKVPYRLQASVTLEWWHGDAGIRGTLTVIAGSKADREALREFAEYVGAETRGPVMRIVFPKREEPPRPPRPPLTQDPGTVTKT